ncbi:helix-turn-helix domain-containing protein [Psychrosphaera sp. B3R10]|nr:helix-turn-helix domain-containing protein [Psychrosphaera sp. I2R16]MBU2989833.1 helix-turn-helix domain-containing protein [Psychrosphaera sp. B3R10]
MKNIVLFAADGAMASQLTGIIDFFMICNRFWQVTNNQDTDLFTVNVISPNGNNITCDGGIVINATSLKNVALPSAAVIVGGVSYDDKTLTKYLTKISPLKQDILKCEKNAVPIATFCSSTFIAAEFGLLNGKKATTVWWLVKIFTQKYPQVTLQLDELVVRDKAIFTAGATTSYLSLCLKLVEELFDGQLADQISRLMLIDPNRCSQRPFMLLDLPERHHDDLIKKIQQWMIQNLSQPISLDLLADKFATTKRTLIRRFKKVLNDTPMNYLQKIRVESAKRLLECSGLSLEQIVLKVGYEDVSSFRKLFVELVELTPREYRERFQQSINANIIEG